MQDLKGKFAVVTGGGCGIGRELVCQLAAAGCHVAACDLSMEGLEATRAACADSGVNISLHTCNVSNESQVQAFAAEVLETHNTECIHLLFNNAGVAGGGSFVRDERQDWERTFDVCWGGVYLCCRHFMAALIAAPASRIINISSVNGMWATMGPHVSHTAYSTAKFAVRGFSEALITDLRLNAPNVSVSVVMPGHIGTGIVLNSQIAQTGGNALQMDADAVSRVRENLVRIEPAAEDLSDDEIRALIDAQGHSFRDDAPTTAAQAATMILDGVQAGQWRILIGEDAVKIDTKLRNEPERAYEPEFHAELVADGVFSTIGQ